MIRRPRLVVVVCVGLLLTGLHAAAWAHPQHRGSDTPEARAAAPLDLAPPGTAPHAGGHPFSHHGSPSPLALGAGALALLAGAVAARRRPLALALALAIAAASFEGAVHAALHLRHASHHDGLSIGASAAVPPALSPDRELSAIPTRLVLGPVPQGEVERDAGVGRASHRGRAPPARPA